MDSAPTAKAKFSREISSHVHIKINGLSFQKNTIILVAGIFENLALVLDNKHMKTCP